MRVYEGYVRQFSGEKAGDHSLTYAVIPTDLPFDFTNLDRWYERDAGERVADYVLYRLKLRTASVRATPFASEAERLSQR